MNEQMVVGFVAVLMAGVMQGIFAVPMKYTRRWKWENIWLVYSTTGMLVLPWATAATLSSEIWWIYAQSSPTALVSAAVFGFAWGLGCVLCGLGLVSLGIALGSSIILGLACALGSLLPLIILHPDRLASTAGILVIAGVFVTIAGVSTCAAAGRAREARDRAAGRAEASNSLYGILLCAASGALSACLNFGFVFGVEISRRAQQAGNSSIASVYPLLAIMLSAAYLANIAYCGLLLTRGRSWRLFILRAGRSHWPLGVLMGLFVFGGVLLYGAGAELLGALGTSAGWGLSMAMMIIAANTAGFLTGEWKGASRLATRRMVSGGFLLLLAILLLGAANGVA